MNMNRLAVKQVLSKSGAKQCYKIEQRLNEKVREDALCQR